MWEKLTDRYGCRSLDGIYKKHGAVAIDIVGKISEAVLRGLTYLYDEHRIMHRGTSVFDSYFRRISMN